MSSIIIKITQDSVSEEYLFNKLGPIFIGSDKQCDLYLDDPALSPKFLEVKLSAGHLYIKEVGARGEIYLDSVILPFRQETLYKEGSCISIKDTKYRIQILQKDNLSIEPPPFLEEDFSEKVLLLDLKIRSRESELANLDLKHEKKRLQVSEVEEKYYKHAADKNKLQFEVSNLKAQKDSLDLEIRKNSNKNKEEEEKIDQLRHFVKKLENDERVLKDNIIAQGLVLTNLKDEREKKSKEVDHQRVLLANLKLDTQVTEDQLKELIQSHKGQEQDIERENLKIESILGRTDTALKEGAKIQSRITQMIKEKALLDHDVSELQKVVLNLEDERRNKKLRLDELRKEISESETIASRILEKIKVYMEEESHLKLLNGELSSELIKAEDKLSLKKNHLNQLEFESQEATRKLANVNIEYERATLRLKDLSSEEKNQEIKMLSLKEDFQRLNRKIDEDKTDLIKEMEVTKNRLGQELQTVKNEIQANGKMKASLESDHQLLKDKIEECTATQRSLNKEKNELLTLVENLRSEKEDVEANISNLKNEVLQFEHEKSRLHRELSCFEIKLLGTETQIKEKIEQSRIELEQMKRDERSKVLSEKEVHLAEVEAFKQKSLVEVETTYRRKLEEVHQVKSFAQEKADEIIREARKVESELTSEATFRLKQATSDARERESLSHARITEAQEYFNKKEKEAEAIVLKARLEARDLHKQAEIELQDDLIKRKQKIKNFLTMKQQNGVKHIESLNLQHDAKLKRTEKKYAQKLEEIKRKELKKIARLRDEELSNHAELRNNLIRDLKAEKSLVLKQLAELRKEQEEEITSKKKIMLEHINSSKFTQQKQWEDELRKEKESFNESKKERIRNATQAVLNLITSTNGFNPSEGDAMRNKITSTLKMALDGQNAKAMNEVDHVLEFNPSTRKKILPVLKKYTIRIALPAAVAIVFAADIASLRTNLVEGAKDLLRQQHSASELYVTQQKIEWKDKHTYHPETTPAYKGSFTDNIIYTTDFEKIMDNEEFQNDWILKVHDYIVKDLELSEDIAINYISSEGTLIKELSLARKDLHPQFLDQGLQKMQDIEQTHLGWLRDKIPESEKLTHFSNFRAKYFNDYVESKNTVERGIASEKLSD